MTVVQRKSVIRLVSLTIAKYSFLFHSPGF